MIVNNVKATQLLLKLRLHMRLCKPELSCESLNVELIFAQCHSLMSSTFS